MNVCVVVDNELNHDIRVMKEIRILLKHGYKVSALCYAHTSSSHEEIEGVQIHRIRISKRMKHILYFFTNRVPLYEYLWSRHIVRVIRKNSIDIIHVHDLYMSKAASKGIKSAGKPVKMILDLHENYPVTVQTYNWTKGFLRNLLANPKSWKKKEGEYLNYADGIIVLSESFRTNLIKKFSFLNKKVIVPFPNVIDFREFETYRIDPTIKRSTSVTLMYFGVIAERRGIFNAIEVIEKCVVAHDADVKLLLIGPVDKADKPKLQSILCQPQMKSCVEHIPWIEISQLPTYMSISDILISPILKNDQHESGVANKIFQYMYGSKPLIVSDCGPQRKIVEDAKCGLTYTNQSEFLEAVLKLVENRSLREEMGREGFKYLSNTFDTIHYESKLIDLYQSI